jgi:hypothetical protein
VANRLASQKTKNMNSNKDYVQFITALNQNIVQSRYTAASLANREQLLLYFRTGKMLSEKIAVQKWGAKVIEQIADDLQKQLPGLRGFSSRNLKNMRQLFDAYRGFAIGQLLTAQLQGDENKLFTIRPPATAQLDDPNLKAFSGSVLPTIFYYLTSVQIPKNDFFIFFRLHLNFGPFPFWSTILKPTYLRNRVSCPIIFQILFQKKFLKRLRRYLRTNI